MFDQFHWETIKLLHDETVTNPTCNQPAEFLLVEVINDVKKVFERWITLLTEQEGEEELGRQLEDLVKTISTGHITEVCVQMTQSYSVNKNWNSHKAKVGVAICDAASLISMIEKCEKPATDSDGKIKLDKNFRQNIPRGRVLTGAMHRSEDNVYIEYMIAPYDRGQESPMTFTNLFLHTKVYNMYHDVYRCLGICSSERAAAIADNHEYRRRIPNPQPTRAHTFNFMCTYSGVHLFDGECKDKSTHEDEEVLLTTALSQFADRNNPLVLLTMSTLMVFYKLVKDDPNHHPKIYKNTLVSYKMGCPRSDNYFPEEDGLKIPSGCEHSQNESFVR